MVRRARLRRREEPLTKQQNDRKPIAAIKMLTLFMIMIEGEKQWNERIYVKIDILVSCRPETPKDGNNEAG